MRYVMYYLITINIIAWNTYGLDKWKAKTGKWRIPERTLLFLALIGGSAGALAGMFLFHHKTKKPKFYVGVPVMLILHCLLILWAVGRIL